MRPRRCQGLFTVLKCATVIRIQLNGLSSVWDLQLVQIYSSTATHHVKHKTHRSLSFKWTENWDEAFWMVEKAYTRIFLRSLILVVYIYFFFVLFSFLFFYFIDFSKKTWRNSFVDKWSICIQQSANQCEKIGRRRSRCKGTRIFCRIPKIPRQKCFISCIQGRIEEANITTTQNSSIAGVNFNPLTPKSD